MKELFSAAAEKPAQERAAYLQDACPDAALREEVGRLLEAEGHPSLESPVGGILAAPALPAAIGRYRIIRLLGEGGMGAVYEAEQDQPRRRVALKVIKAGLAGPALLRRFEHEAQALGRLHHPGIAQIYEAGTADSGFGPQPYFAMEFIQGASLLRYAQEHRLSTRQRLELMAKICDAVQHAHQRGIIHRDLKPGNILVDDTGQPKIVDFGVARATDADVKTTLHTGYGQILGTLAYRSPGQVLADPLELDTRSDVYALGVILFELLAVPALPAQRPTAAGGAVRPRGRSHTPQRHRSRLPRRYRNHRRKGAREGQVAALRLGPRSSPPISAAT
jgi:serine/threonine protein kinase